MAIQYSRNSLVYPPTQQLPHIMKLRSYPKLPLDHMLNLSHLDNKEKLKELIHPNYDQFRNRVQKELNILLDEANKARKEDEIKKMKQFNLKLQKEELFEINTEVMRWINHNKGGERSRKFRNRWDPHWIVKEVFNKGINYKIKNLKTGEERVEHRDNLRRYNHFVLMIQHHLLRQNEEIELQKYYQIEARYHDYIINQLKHLNEIKRKPGDRE